MLTRLYLRSRVSATSLCHVSSISSSLVNQHVCSTLNARVTPTNTACRSFVSSSSPIHSSTPSSSHATPPPTATGSPAPTASAGAVIFEVTAENVRDVFDSPIPVMLDCYADWCQPCKELTPKLELYALKNQKKIRLAKLNVEEQGDLVASLGLPIQSLPTVLGIYQKKLVTHFTGNVSDQQIKDFVDKLLALTPDVAEEKEEETGPIATDLASLESLALDKLFEQAGKLFESGSLEDAGTMYKTVLSNPNKKKEWNRVRGRATAGLIRCIVAGYDDPSATTYQPKPEWTGVQIQLCYARHILDELQQRAQTDKILKIELENSPAKIEIQKATHEVDLAMDLARYGQKSIEEAAEVVQTNPKDPQALLQLSLAYFAAMKADEAVETGLKLARVNRVMGRDLLLRYFSALGDTNTAVQMGRKKLMAILY